MAAPQIRQAWRPFLSAVAFALTIASAHGAAAQQVFYSHTSGVGGDGFVWDDDFEPGPNNLGDGNEFYTPDGVYYFNYSGNVSYFDDSYQAAGASGLIDGDAWWGNPLDDGGYQVGMYFEEFSTVETLSFDFSWALAGQDAPTEIYFDVSDYTANEGQGAYTSVYVELDQTFNAGAAFGGFDGAAGHVTFDINELSDDGEGTPFSVISEFYLYLDEILTTSGTGEFAIDNVSINGAVLGDSRVFPSVNGGTVNVSGSSILTSLVREEGVWDYGLSFTNAGSVATTFSTELLPGGDLGDPGQPTGEPLLAGETRYFPSVAQIDASSPSGTYRSDIRVMNDENPGDPDDETGLRVGLHDAPALTANNSAPAPAGIGVLQLSNAAAGPHEGALRAGVAVNAVDVTGPFEVVGMSTASFVGPDDTIAGDIEFNRFGRRSGVYNGTATLQLTMRSATGNFMSNAAPVDNVVWSVAHDQEDLMTDSHSAGAGEAYAETVGVNTAMSAATIVGGETPEAVSYSLEIVSAPTPNAVVSTDVFETSFDVESGLYVLQMTYDPEALPTGATPLDLLPLHFDENASLWEEAAMNNSDGGAGAAFYAGAYADYLAGAGGGVLDAADLSAYGVDAASDQVWVVLDNPGSFAVGLLGLPDPLAGDYNNNGVVDAADFTVWRDNLGEAAGALPNDVDGGVIGAAQYDTWVAHFGQTREAAQSPAVPEPSCVALLGLAAGAFARRRRH
ncbi:hypothetical protein Mal64_11550 [Pseudobythopirellula maris]|uniref:PEP-CTERM protein-sorting domain-containing protein n=1 Tax=Pseudobythopirellula maris TaxID=2527991 RepID=A0A5C5ZUN4_9BACT|nr:PEP-CTERM sorting domain-containing protein [Pseudobythopirellula maris]TWT90758.1 hypothetical protein Mal64_11550 [Pseudobythopirellula maris]